MFEHLLNLLDPSLEAYLWKIKYLCIRLLLAEHLGIYMEHKIAQEEVLVVKCWVPYLDIQIEATLMLMKD